MAQDMISQGTSEDTLGLDDYKSVRRKIEAGFETRLKRLEVERRRAIETLNEAWPKMGGSTKDITRFEAYEEAVPHGESTVVNHPRDDSPAPNSSFERTVPMKAVRRATQDVLDDEIEVITQTVIQDRLLREHPDAEIQPLRVSISRLLRELKEQNKLILIEAGRGGVPNKYRKNRDVEVGLLE